MVHLTSLMLVTYISSLQSLDWKLDDLVEQRFSLLFLLLFVVVVVVVVGESGFSCFLLQLETLDNLIGFSFHQKHEALLTLIEYFCLKFLLLHAMRHQVE